jgi:tetratricopeptide (TPR) repeat protein
MDLELVEPPRLVLEAFRRGEFDGLEVLGQADEQAFFELGFREKLLDALAAAMPTARKKEEVPRGVVLMANLSLKLHGEHAFHALERGVRCGGLLSALDPAIASKHLDPQSREVVLRCVGFNDKNGYDRQTPCDQDMVRKYVRDVPAPQWQDWFNGAVQEDPLDGESLVLLAHHYGRANPPQIEKAELLYQRAMEINGTRFKARIRCAELQVRLGHYGEAVKLLQAAQDLEHHDYVAGYLEQVERLARAQR